MQLIHLTICQLLQLSPKQRMICFRFHHECECCAFRDIPAALGPWLPADAAGLPRLFQAAHKQKQRTSVKLDNKMFSMISNWSDPCTHTYMQEWNNLLNCHKIFWNKVNTTMVIGPLDDHTYCARPVFTHLGGGGFHENCMIYHCITSQPANVSYNVLDWHFLQPPTGWLKFGQGTFGLPVCAVRGTLGVRDGTSQ